MDLKSLMHWNSWQLFNTFTLLSPQDPVWSYRETDTLSIGVPSPVAAFASSVSTGSRPTFGAASVSVSIPVEEVVVRKTFPESWIWEDIQNGRLVLKQDRVGHLEMYGFFMWVTCLMSIDAHGWLLFKKTNIFLELSAISSIFAIVLCCPMQFSV